MMPEMSLTAKEQMKRIWKHIGHQSSRALMEMALENLYRIGVCDGLAMAIKKMEKL